MQKLVILDRDGVINFDSPAYIRSPAEWQPIPGSLAAIALLKTKGYKVAIATNQSGLGRGYFSLQTLNAIHAKLLADVRQAGGDIAHISYCPHLPDTDCACRKPKPGLMLELFTKLHIDPAVDLVFAVGDSERDITAASAAHCSPILVLTGNGEKTRLKLTDTMQVPIYANLLEFVQAL